MGDLFGELALLGEQPQAASVTAGNRVEALVLSRKKFERLLGSLSQLHKSWYLTDSPAIPSLFGGSFQEPPRTRQDVFAAPMLQLVDRQPSTSASSRNTPASPHSIQSGPPAAQQHRNPAGFQLPALPASMRARATIINVNSNGGPHWKNESGDDADPEEEYRI